MKIGDAFIAIKPDFKGFEDEVNSGMGERMKGIAAAGAAALATAGVAVGGFAAKSVMAASDLGEATSKVNVVFGESAQAILDWGSTTEGTLLISKQQALDAAGTYGNLFTSFGLTDDAAAKMSVGMVQLAQDLSSFNNIPIEQALEALRSGLTGETEPLKALGAAFSAAELEAKALEMGLVAEGDELDNAAKSQAAYALIMEKTTNAQGDAARTADGLANQLRILKADAMDTMAGVGEALIPLATELVQSLGDLFDEIAPMLADIAQDLAPVIGGIVKQIGPLVERLAPVLSAVFAALGDVLENIPWDMVVVAIGNLGSAIVTLLPVLTSALKPVLEALGILLPPLSAIFMLIADTLAAMLMPVIEAVSPLLITLAEIIDSQLNDVLERLWPVLQEVGAQLGEAVATAVVALTPLLLQLIDALLPLLPPILDLIEALLPVLVDLFSTLMPIVTELAEVVINLTLKALNPVIETLSDLIGWVTDVVTAFGEWWDGLDEFWQNVQEWVSNIDESIGGLIDGIVGWVEDALGSLGDFFTGVWDGIKAVINNIIRGWNSLEFSIPEMDPLGAFGPSIGPFTIGLPDIPELATGALVRGSTLAIVGDRPEGEAVLTRPQLRELIAWAGQDMRGSGGVTFTGPVTFGADMGAAVRELDWWARYSMGVAA